MAVRPITTIPDPVLIEKCAKVKNFDNALEQVIKDLVDTLDTAHDPEGAGLAAPQIGIPLRICAVKNFFEDPANPHRILSETIVLVNPKIISHSAETDVDWEGCLSVPDQYGRVERFSKIKVTAQDELGNNIKVKASDFLARVIQHEIDHLDGILFTEKVTGPIIPEKELDKLLGIRS